MIDAGVEHDRRTSGATPGDSPGSAGHLYSKVGVLASVLLFTGLAAALRLYLIGADPLWLDEAFSVWMARHPARELLDLLVRVDPHPPLYYLLLHVWLRLGDSETLLRLLSALAGILTIPLVYALGRVVGGARLGMLTALLMALSPFHLRYSQETRMYGLLTLEAALALWGLAWLLRWRDLAAQPIGTGWRSWWMARRVGREATPAALTTDGAWAAYVLGTATALLTHASAVLLLAATNLAVLAYWVGGTRGRGFLRNWLLAQGAVLGLWALWLPMFVLQSVGTYQHIRLPTRPPQEIVIAFHALYVSFVGRNFLVRTVLDLFVLTLAGLGLWGWRRERRWIIFAIVLWLASPLAELVVAPWKPIFLDRTLIWTIIPFQLMVAAGLAQFRRRTVFAVLLVALTLVDLRGIRNYYVYWDKWAWDRVAAYVAHNLQSDDLILFNANYLQLPFDYYFEREARPAARHGVPADYPGPRVMTSTEIPRLKALAKSHKRVWLIYGDEAITDPGRLVPAALESLGQQAVGQRVGGIEVQLYELRTSGP